VGKRAGGVLHTHRFENFRTISSEKEKKPLVLTLGSPPEKGEKKKTPRINPGQPARKGREKKNPSY
jgi:hypothetical protein